MPIRVQRVPNQPILITTFSGYITVDDVIDMYRASAEMIGNEEGTFHRISDVRDARTNFVEMIKVLQTAAKDMSVSSMDGRIEVTFVGTSSWINFVRDFFAKKGVPMAAFKDIEAAFESVHWRITHEKEQRVLDAAKAQAALSSS